MCLRVNRRLPKLTTKDIVVYKELRNWFDGTYHAPYTGYEVKLHKVCRAKGCLLIFLVDLLISKKIGQCCFHAHKQKGPGFYKAIIPKYTLYWEDNYLIAARKMIFTEELE